MTDRITLPKLINVHDHLRDNELMEEILRFVTRGYAITIAEPNLSPQPILLPKHMIAYRDRVMRALDKLKLELTVYFLFQVTKDTTPAIVRAFRKLWYCIGGKSYYYKTTTNSEIGIQEVMDPKHAYLEMREVEFMSQHHGEMPRLPGTRISWMRSEGVFFQEAAPRLVDEFEGLRLDFQHLSTAIATDFVIKTPANVTAGFTIAHMRKTMDDVEGHLLHAENFMKPHLKDYPDLDAIVAAALSDSDKFHPTPDSAAHLKRDKLKIGGCAGGFSIPVIPEEYLQFFDDHNALDRAKKFLCDNPYRTYRLPEPKETITFVRKRWSVPDQYETSIAGPGSELIPYKRGENVEWQIEGVQEHYNR